MEIYYAKDANGRIKEFQIGKTRVTLKQSSNNVKVVGTIIEFDHRFNRRCYTVKWDNDYQPTNHHGTELLIHSGQKVALDDPNASFKAHRRKNK